MLRLAPAAETMFGTRNSRTSATPYIDAMETKAHSAPYTLMMRPPNAGVIIRLTFCVTVCSAVALSK